MKQDRFLWIVFGVIVALIVLALVLFFSRQNSLEYTDDPTPKGVVRNYVVALLIKDYEKAYSYLAEEPHKPSLESFITAFNTKQLDPSLVSMEIGDVTLAGQKATVNLLLLHSSTDPFSSGYNEMVTATLKQNSQGEWKISNMPYPYWSWDWYNPTVEPLRAPGSD